MAREVITEADVERYEARSEIVVSKGTVITPSALDRAASRGIKVVFRVDEERPIGASRPLTPPRAGAPEPPLPVFPPAAARISSPSAGAPSGEALTVIVTAVGRNRPGVLSEITTALARLDGNVVDLSQKMIQGYFNLIVIVDFSQSSVGYDSAKQALEGLSREGDYRVTVQNEKVFRAMHRI